MRNRGFGLNDSEREVHEKYENLGYDIIHIGVPDFILLKDGTIKFVEVKHGYDRLREEQERAHKLLKKHGFDVRVERIPIRKHPHLYERWLVDNPADQVLSTPCQDNPDHASSSHAAPNHARSFQPTPSQTIPLQSRSRQLTPHQSSPDHFNPSPNQKEVKKNE